MFFLKLFVIGRDSPAEVGQHCSDNFFSHLETHAQSSPSVLPWLTSWRALKGWLYKHEWNGVKSVLYQVNYKRKWISPPCSLFPLFFFVSLPHFWNIRAAGLMQDLKTGDLSSLSPFSASSLALSGQSAALDSVLRFVVRIWGLLKCVVWIKGLLASTFETK